MSSRVPTRDELAEKYLEDLPFEPYPVQEDALLAWFTAEQGVLVCAPTGTGKTLIAEAALFEALHTGTVAYYTTPLIALTEQKFAQMQQRAVGWGFCDDDVGLVTGHRRVNPNARILVVVAEILLNRLLKIDAVDFANVSAVVMDEFHSFNDPQRGVVWELSLGLLPAHVRLLLLSATVGNSAEFIRWLDHSHGRRIELIQSSDRKVPLTYQWVEDRLLGEQILWMASGAEGTRKTPALLFCFARDTCWSIAEQLKGLDLLSEGQRIQLTKEVDALDWTQGVGPKLCQMFRRGVGVHHAGLLPKYRRVVEDLFERKLLTVIVCTETLGAGINLPARSVLLMTLVKGPRDGKKLVDPSTAHQLFGRAGRPQFDDEGFVYAMAHEDDIKILRWKTKYDSIPENTKDLGLRQAKKALLRKRPTRRNTETYWTQPQFEKLQVASPGNLASKGPIPWRLLAYLLKISPEVSIIRAMVRKRLMDEHKIKGGETGLVRMLRTLGSGGFVKLQPEPPGPTETVKPADSNRPEPKVPGLFSQLLSEATLGKKEEPRQPDRSLENQEPQIEKYFPELAIPTPELDKLLAFRSIHPIYGVFLLEQLGIADRTERIQALESVLEIPRSLWRRVQVPFAEEMPPGPLQTTRLDAELISRGLIRAQVPDSEEEEEEDEEEYRPPLLAEKLRLLFDATYSGVRDVKTHPVWAAGELFRFDGDFAKYVKTHDLVKQEGILFRHMLRLILLCGEFATLCPPEVTQDQWQVDLRDISDRLTESCRAIDPSSTDKMIEETGGIDVVVDEKPS